MSLAAKEQYLLELINQARLNPLVEQNRYGIALNDGLPAGSISSSAVQPVAPNARLSQAAEGHSKWMLEEDIFSHTGQNGSNAYKRILETGYTFEGRWAWRENLAWTGTTGRLDDEAAIQRHHDMLYDSPYHRINTFSESVAEIGVAQVTGQFTSKGTAYNASMLTLNYAGQNNERFITGVSYSDSNANWFYNIGEAVAGTKFSVNGQSSVSSSAGGYALKVGGSDLTSGLVFVDMRQGETALGRVQVDLSQGNVKLDTVVSHQGAMTVLSSSDITLVSGVQNAALLGERNLSLTGNDQDNTLRGNSGDNTLKGLKGSDSLIGSGGSDQLFGGDGDDSLSGGQGRDDTWAGLDSIIQNAAIKNSDKLEGGAGHDQLHGQSGHDVLSGGVGHDVLSGGSGRDTFIFTSGQDHILDFTQNVDLIHIDRNLLTPDQSLADLVEAAHESDGAVILAFSNDHSLKIDGTFDLSLLENDILLI